eukprot:g68952.t1
MKWITFSMNCFLRESFRKLHSHAHWVSNPLKWYEHGWDMPLPRPNRRAARTGEGREDVAAPPARRFAGEFVHSMQAKEAPSLQGKRYLCLSRAYARNAPSMEASISCVLESDEIVTVSLVLQDWAQHQKGWTKLRDSLGDILIPAEGGAGALHNTQPVSVEELREGVRGVDSAGSTPPKEPTTAGGFACLFRSQRLLQSAANGRGSGLGDSGRGQGWGAEDSGTSNITLISWQEARAEVLELQRCLRVVPAGGRMPSLDVELGGVALAAPATTSPPVALATLPLQGALVWRVPSGTYASEASIEIQAQNRSCAVLQSLLGPEELHNFLSLLTQLGARVETRTVFGEGPVIRRELFLFNQKRASGVPSASVCTKWRRAFLVLQSEGALLYTRKPDPQTQVEEPLVLMEQIIGVSELGPEICAKPFVLECRHIQRGGECVEWLMLSNAEQVQYWLGVFRQMMQHRASQAVQAAQGLGDSGRLTSSFGPARGDAEDGKPQSRHASSNELSRPDLSGSGLLKPAWRESSAGPGEKGGKRFLYPLAL